MEEMEGYCNVKVPLEHQEAGCTQARFHHWECPTPAHKHGRTLHTITIATFPYLEYLVELVYFGLSLEKWFVQQQLCKYTPHRPHVYWSTVHLGMRGEDSEGGGWGGGGSGHWILHIPMDTPPYFSLSFEPSRSSGALYHSVTTTGVYPFRGDPYSLASPKSPT